MILKEFLSRSGCTNTILYWWAASSWMDIWRGDSSQKARDMHVLQQLRNALQQKEVVVDFGSLLEMRYVSSVNQGLDLLLECRKLNANEFLDCIDSIIEQYGRADALDAESRLLLSRSRLLSRLVRLYIHLKDMQSRPPDYDTATKSSAVSLEVFHLSFNSFDSFAIDSVKVLVSEY